MNWAQIQKASVAELITWAQSQEWCRAMAQCAQDPRWHAEGDVWTHTQMVIEEVQRLDEWPNLSHEDRTVLVMVALLHDVAKPLTTKVDSETGYISSPKHAVKGEHLARQILRDASCDLETREHICSLVRVHGRPAFLAERSSPVDEVVRMSWRVSNRLLYLFALADTRGRTTESMTKPEENLHFWKMVAQEAGCYEASYPFQTDHARFTFFNAAEPNLHYVPHEDFSCEVTIMCGLPGSGKDRWIAEHHGGREVVALDEVREQMDIDPTDNQGPVAQKATERCKELLRSGTSFVFNATNITLLNRRRWTRLMANYRAHIEIVHVEPSINKTLAQNKSRERSVPEHVIRRLADRFEPPTWWECHQLAKIRVSRLAFMSSQRIDDLLFRRVVRCRRIDGAHATFSAY